MNLIKLLKVLGVGYLAGQVVASKYWNKDVEKKLVENKNEWSKKFQTLFDHLMNVNRDFFSDVKNYDYQRSADDMKTWAQDQYASIETQVNSIKEKWEDYINSPEVQKVVAKLQDQVASVKSKTSKLANDFDLNQSFDNISSSLKKFGNNVSKKADDLKDAASEKISDVKADARNLANKAADKAQDVAHDVKKTASNVANKVENKANQVKSDAKKVAANIEDEYNYDMDSKPHGNVSIQFKNDKNS